MYGFGSKVELWRVGGSDVEMGEQGATETTSTERPELGLSYHDILLGYRGTGTTKCGNRYT
jgi:hypothetical protein